MKLPRLRTILLTPLILFALVYIVGVITMVLNDDPVAVLEESPVHPEAVAIFGASGTAGDGILKAALVSSGIKRIHVITRRQQFENGDYPGTWNIGRYSDAYVRRHSQD